MQRATRLDEDIKYRYDADDYPDDIEDCIWIGLFDIGINGQKTTPKQVQ
jgi:hypothetical protein